MRFFTVKNLFFSVSLFTLLVAVTFLPQLADGQSAAKVARQQKSEVLLLIEKAEQNQYTVNHIDFSGNIQVPGRDLRDRFATFLSPGDLFSRRNLYRSLKNLSKLNRIYEVSLENVEVSLDEKGKYIDLTITVRERGGGRIVSDRNSTRVNK